MGWKHVDVIQMGPPSAKERVGNSVMIGPNKEVIESSIGIEGEEMEGKMPYMDIVRI